MCAAPSRVDNVTADPGSRTFDLLLLLALSTRKEIPALRMTRNGTTSKELTTATLDDLRNIFRELDGRWPGPALLGEDHTRDDDMLLHVDELMRWDLPSKSASIVLNRVTGLMGDRAITYERGFICSSRECIDGRKHHDYEYKRRVQSSLLIRPTQTALGGGEPASLAAFLLPFLPGISRT